MGLVWMVDGVARRDPPVAAAGAAVQSEMGTGAAARAQADGSGAAVALADDGRAGRRRGDPWAVAVSAVMTTPVTVLNQADPLRAAALLMGQRGFLHVPVVSDLGTLVGIVSDRDLLRHLGDHRRARREGDPMAADLASVMTAPVLAITPASSLREAARALGDRKISSLPVIDDECLPVGILTLADILAYALAQPDVEFWVY